MMQDVKRLDLIQVVDHRSVSNIKLAVHSPVFGIMIVIINRDSFQCSVRHGGHGGICIQTIKHIIDGGSGCITVHGGSIQISDNNELLVFFQAMRVFGHGVTGQNPLVVTINVERFGVVNIGRPISNFIFCVCVWGGIF